jgi:hypothetical protein
VDDLYRFAGQVMGCWFLGYAVGVLFAWIAKKAGAGSGPQFFVACLSPGLFVFVGMASSPTTFGAAALIAAVLSLIFLAKHVGLFKTE